MTNAKVREVRREKVVWVVLRCAQRKRKKEESCVVLIFYTACESQHKIYQTQRLRPTRVTYSIAQVQHDSMVCVVWGPENKVVAQLQRQLQLQPLDMNPQ